MDALSQPCAVLPWEKVTSGLWESLKGGKIGNGPGPIGWTTCFDASRNRQSALRSTWGNPISVRCGRQLAAEALTGGGDQWLSAGGGLKQGLCPFGAKMASGTARTRERKPLIILPSRDPPPTCPSLKVRFLLPPLFFAESRRCC